MFARRFAINDGTSFTAAAAILFLLGFMPMPFGSLGTFIFAAAALIAIVLMVRRRVAWRVPPPLRFAAGACLFYFAVNLLSPLTYADGSGGWMPIVSSLHFVLFVPLALALATSDDDPIAAYVRGARVGAIVGGLIAVLQLVDGLDRASGGAVSSYPFGAAAAWFTAVSLIQIGHSRRELIFSAVAFAFGLGASILSESRGVWLALPVLMIVALLYFKARFGFRTAAAGFGVLAVVAVGVLAAASDSVRERFEETFAMFEGFEFGAADRSSSDEYSLDQRALMLAYGVDAIGDRPLLGYGPQNAVEEVRRRAAADGYSIQRYNHLHNEYLTETVGNGLIGLISLLLILAAPPVVAYRSVRDSAYPERVALGWFATAGAATYGLTSLAFGNDITNTVFVGMLLTVSLSAVASAKRAGAAA